jgi:hypothetical protein
MKTKYVLLVLGLLIAGAGFWFGRAAWQSKHQLVTLHVRNLPLADVLRSIERQTGTKIRAEQSLDTHITLNVTAKPLAYVLNRVAEQAGARWSTLYAVYESHAALGKLETALRGDSKLDDAGWTKIAPAALVMNLPGPDAKGPGPMFLAGPGTRNLPTNLPPGAVVTSSDEIAVEHGSMKPGVKSGPATAKRERSPTIVRVVRNGPDGAGKNFEAETWSPEEMVLESALSPRLGTETIEAATAETAAETAEKVKGHWALYYALKKSRIGPGFGNVQMTRRGPGDPKAHGSTPAGTVPGANLKIAGDHIGQAIGDLEAAMRQSRADELGRLTPEQRVQRARERQNHRPN